MLQIIELALNWLIADQELELPFSYYLLQHIENLLLRKSSWPHGIMEGICLLCLLENTVDGKADPGIEKTAWLTTSSREPTEYISCHRLFVAFTSGSVVKNPPAMQETRMSGSIPGSERSPEGRHSNPFQYFCLGHRMDRRAWWATVHGVAKETRLSD